MIASKEKYSKIIKKLKDDEIGWTSGKNSSITYAKNHQKRHNKVFKFCRQFVPQKDAKVLDIGRSNLTSILNSYYSNISTLGLPLNADNGGHREIDDLSNINHIEFDLNRSDEVNEWPSDTIKFDLIVFSETIEHLIIAPELIYLFLDYLLKPGGVIVLTTPNAVSFRKRVLMTLGKNPFEKIRFYKENPGHYREYTKKELLLFGKERGFDVLFCKTVNFFLYPTIYFLKFLGVFFNINNDIVAVYRKK